MKNRATPLLTILIVIFLVMIRAVIFDYGNVISRFDNNVFLRTIARYSLLTDEQMLAAVRKDPQLVLDYECGRIQSEEFYKRVAEQLHLSIAIGAFHDSFVKIFERIPSTIDIIKRLKPRFKLGLLSNTNEWHFKAEIETLEVFPLFDAVTLSYEVGAMKPSPAIYRDALSKLNVLPEECVYIDDIEKYADAARQLGMLAVHYRSHEQLLASLREMGINEIY